MITMNHDTVLIENSATCRLSTCHQPEVQSFNNLSPTCHLYVVPDSTKVSTGTFSANVIAKISITFKLVYYRVDINRNTKGWNIVVFGEFEKKGLPKKKNILNEIHKTY